MDDIKQALTFKCRFPFKIITKTAIRLTWVNHKPPCQFNFYFEAFFYWSAILTEVVDFFTIYYSYLKRSFVVCSQCLWNLTKQWLLPCSLYDACLISVCALRSRGMSKEMKRESFKARWLHIICAQERDKAFRETPFSHFLKLIQKLNLLLGKVAWTEEGNDLHLKRQSS